MKRSVSTCAALALLLSLDGARAEMYLAWQNRLLEHSAASISVRSEEKSLSLKLFTPWQHEVRLEAEIYQASGPLAAPVEVHSLVVPPGVEGQVVREVVLPLPFAGAEKPIRLRVVIRRDDAGKTIVGVLDIKRIAKGYLEALEGAIRDARQAIVVSPGDHEAEALLRDEQIPFTSGQDIPLGEAGVLISPLEPNFAVQMANGKRIPIKYCRGSLDGTDFGDKLCFLETLADSLSTNRSKP